MARGGERLEPAVAGDKPLSRMEPSPEWGSPSVDRRGSQICRSQRCGRATAGLFRRRRDAVQREF